MKSAARATLNASRSCSSVVLNKRSSTTMPIDLYYVPASSPCRAVIMTAKQLDIDINLKLIDLMGGEQNKPEFLKMNPQHCVPTIDDNGFYLWESRTIITYLANKYAPDSCLYPKDPQKRAVVDRMLYFDLGTVYKAVADYIYPTMFQKEKPDPAKKEVLKKAIEVLNSFLAKTPYVAGSKLTLADISILSNLQFAEHVVDFDFSAYPKVSAWMKKIKSEISCNEEINEKPLRDFKIFLKTLSK